MNGTIASKNFKATFTMETEFSAGAAADKLVTRNVQIIGTSSEARKYLKTTQLIAQPDLQGVVIQLQHVEHQLRTFVLAKIGG